MIIGFGNNVVSSLAADITASQTTIQVMPGAGEMFAKLLTSDFVNTSNPMKVYAKITLTDEKETVFEVCHLTAVDGDMLTVVRGQEGTTAKGWSLNDVIANFATRGSENQFVQIEQLQSGQYTSGVAAGTANALTLALPANYFVNGSTDWVLRSPIVVYPVQNNTGAATLQLTLGGRVLGTFPLYKGNKAELVADDILKDTALVCLMDKTKTFFNVANPGAIYAGLGTAAFRDVQTSRDDVTPGRVLVTGSAIATRSVSASSFADAFTDDANNLPANSVSFVYASAKNSPGFEASVIDYSGISGRYNTQFAASYAQPGKLRFRTKNGDIDQWNPWMDIITTTGGTITGPLRVDGGLGLGTDNALGGGSIAIGDNDTGFKQIGDGKLALMANSVLAGHFNEYELQHSKKVLTQVFRAIFDDNWSAGAGGFAFQADVEAPFYSPEIRRPNNDNNYFPLIKQKVTLEGGYPVTFSMGLLTTGQTTFPQIVIQAKTDNESFDRLWIFDVLSGETRTPGQINAGGGILNTDGDIHGSVWGGGLRNWLERFQLKNSASKAQNGWHKDASTGIITQWGYASGGNDDSYYTVTLPMTFPSAFVSLQVYPIYSGAITSGHTLSSAGEIKSNSQFGYGISDGSSNSVTAKGVYWIAIGY